MVDQISMKPRWTTEVPGKGMAGGDQAGWWGAIVNGGEVLLFLGGSTSTRVQ